MPLRAFIVSCLIGAAIWFLRPTNLVDDVWSDLLLVNQKLSADASIVLVNVTANDILNNGVDRLSRSYLAETLLRLNQARVARIVVDFGIGREILPVDEQALEAAMRQLGPSKLAMAYEPDPLLRPKSSLLKHSVDVDLRLRADRDGRFRSLKNPDTMPLNAPAIWLAHGDLRPEDTEFDLRVDPRTFRTFTLAELHQPNFDLRQLFGKRIILSLDRTVSKSRANIPVHGAVDRGTLVGLATHAALSDYHQRTRLGHALAVAMATLCLGLGFLIGIRSVSFIKAAFKFSCLVAAIICISLFSIFVIGARGEPGTLILIAMCGLYTAIAHRLRLPELISGFLSGQLSPEEVWIWRSKGEHEGPAILFNAMGGIKCANVHAYLAFELDPKALKAELSPLANLCFPALGHRAEQVTSTQTERRIWKLDWPHPHLPLVLFNDVTESIDQISSLERKLVTDPLTGVFNRAGFDLALTRLGKEGEQNYAIFFMDMNGFKQVNDTYGHEAGDDLLKETAARLSGVLGSKTVLARLGGDEFGAIVEKGMTDSLALDLRNNLEATLKHPIELGLITVKVGIAVGFAIPISALDTTADVLKRADAEMYARKAKLKDSMALPPATTAIIVAPVVPGFTEHASPLDVKV